jgi:hypothetical protein
VQDCYLGGGQWIYQNNDTEGYCRYLEAGPSDASMASSEAVNDAPQDAPNDAPIDAPSDAPIDAPKGDGTGNEH